MGVNNAILLISIKFYPAPVQGVWPRAPEGWPACGFSLASYKGSEVSGTGWGDSMLWPSWRVQPQIIINWLFKKSCKLFFLSVCLKLLLINFSHVPTHHLGWIIDLTVPVFHIPEIHRPPVLRMQLGGSSSEEVGQLSWNSEIFRNCCDIERISRPASLLQIPMLPNSQQCCCLALYPLTQGEAIVAGTCVQAFLFL